MMRRLFIMRKDLHMSTGKLLAQTCHCAEAYWTRQLRKENVSVCTNGEYAATIFIPKDIYEQYVCGYTPVSLGKIIKDGVLSGIKDMHRQTIDRQIERKSEKVKADDEERYILSEWGCLLLTLNDYGVNTDKISGRVGKHIVEDFMELMCKAGYIVKNESQGKDYI